MPLSIKACACIAENWHWKWAACTPSGQYTKRKGFFDVSLYVSLPFFVQSNYTIDFVHNIQHTPTRKPTKIYIYLQKWPFLLLVWFSIGFSEFTANWLCILKCLVFKRSGKFFQYRPQIRTKILIKIDYSESINVKILLISFFIYFKKKLCFLSYDQTVCQQCANFHAKSLAKMCK